MNWRNVLTTLPSGFQDTAFPLMVNVVMLVGSEGSYHRERGATAIQNRVKRIRLDKTKA